MSSATPLRVVVADDHPFIRLGIQAAIEAQPTLKIVGTASDSTELIALLDETECDLVVTDYAMPGGRHGDGSELLSLLQTRYPDLKVVVMTGLDQPVMILSLSALGINHIISKADDTFHVPKAIMAAQANRRYYSPSIAQLLPSRGPVRAPAVLSPRELEVLTLFVSGKGVNEIAELLNRRKQTISTQKVSGMRKLSIERDADLFKFAVELGLRAAPGSEDPAA
ncbi:response regulator transcription factor [Stenotrophomonas sp. C3(2023)]|uniref:response regulator transcription factor n=1 Tax=Stenotrophomonas sp. C3(2023) TaxID=3080277 RepID=UPI00293C1570|nr:response regulator transcription factor [Stenotrophomonas sp. C3(2023)]MDV3468544.1 response regulator transcription factor [Stenotrophomonas sp. C3(2023)]